MGKFKGECSVSWYIDRKNSWKSGIPSRAPELLALRANKGSKIAPEKCENQTIALPSIEMYEDQSLIMAEIQTNIDSKPAFTSFLALNSFGIPRGCPIGSIYTLGSGS